MRPVILLLLLTCGCADLGHQGQDQIRVTPVYTRWYTNRSGGYEALYLPDGRVVPVPAGHQVDLDAAGVQDYVVHEAPQ